MPISQRGINLIKAKESFRSHSYKDGGGVWTIGYGSTMWKDGKRVKEGELISLETAEDLLMWEVNTKTTAITSVFSKTVLNQNQVDAIISFVYNVGVGGFLKSTLCKKIKINPNDETIRAEFMKWVYDDGKKVDGLVNRRQTEADLYFSI